MVNVVGRDSQVVIALIVTPQGFPLSYEVMSGDTADSTTLSGFLDRINHRYGQANRIWVMDRGIPTEDSLAKMRSIGASYLVGTPKAGLNKPEQSFLSQPSAKVRQGVQVKRLATDEDVYGASSGPSPGGSGVNTRQRATSKPCGRRWRKRG